VFLWQTKYVPVSTISRLSLDNSLLNTLLNTGRISSSGVLAWFTPRLYKDNQWVKIVRIQSGGKFE
jgi:hypothetical protein